MLPLLIALIASPADASSRHHVRPAEAFPSYSSVEVVYTPVRYEPPRERHVRPYQHKPPPMPVDARTIHRMVIAVDDATFSDDQVELIASLAAHHYFTVDQVALLIEPIAFSSSRLDAVRALRGVIVDPENAWQLESSFVFSSDRRELRRLFT